MPEKLDSSIVLLPGAQSNGDAAAPADLILDEFELAGVKGLAFMFDGLVSNTQVSDFLRCPHKPQAPAGGRPEKLWEYLRSQFLFSSEQGIVETYEDLFTKAMSGFAMVMLDGVPRALSLGYQGFETRGVGEPAMEKNLRGSREGFTESNNTNTAMVRRRLKSPNLTVETLYLGRQSRTNVRLCYLSDVAAPKRWRPCGKNCGRLLCRWCWTAAFYRRSSARGRRRFSAGRAPPSAPIPCAQAGGGQSGRYGGRQPQCDDRALPLHRAFPYAG